LAANGLILGAQIISEQHANTKVIVSIDAMFSYLLLSPRKCNAEVDSSIIHMLNECATTQLTSTNIFEICILQRGVSMMPKL